MLRKIDGIAVGVEDSVFGFAVGRALVDAGGGVQVLASFADCGDVFNFETEVIDACLQLRPFSSSSAPANLIIVSHIRQDSPSKTGIASSAWIQSVGELPPFRNSGNEVRRSS